MNKTTLKCDSFVCLAEQCLKCDPKNEYECSTCEKGHSWDKKIYKCVELNYFNKNSFSIS